MKEWSTLPGQEGFSMPGEYETHEACWMLWPQRPDVWRLGGKPAQQAFAQVAQAIRRFEPVIVGVNADQYENACQVLNEDIRVVEISSNDAWMRDCGPTFVRNGQGEVRGVDWDFNAWGGLHSGAYFPWDLDARVCRKVCEIAGVESFRAPGFVLEGGSIHCDGEGTVLTTEECLLHPNRNPHLSKEEIEEKLIAYLGCEKVIWLKRGMYLDETDGHVDNICCFARPGEVFLAWTDQQEDPQYAISQECLEILQNATDARGRQLKVHKLPCPAPVTITREEAAGIDQSGEALARRENTRMAASYANFYFANGGLVFPLFDDPADEQARRIFESQYPQRQVVGVPSREIILGGGNIHCITQQQPLGME